MARGMFQKASNVYFISNIPRILAGLVAAENRTLNQAGSIVALAAAKNAPIDTGLLSGSMDWAVEPEKHQVTIGSPIYYAPFVEFGTGQRGRATADMASKPDNYVHGARGGADFIGIPAQPYLEPAMVDSIPAIAMLARKEYKTVERTAGLSVRFPDEPG